MRTAGVGVGLFHHMGLRLFGCCSPRFWVLFVSPFPESCSTSVSCSQEGFRNPPEAALLGFLLPPLHQRETHAQPGLIWTRECFGYLWVQQEAVKMSAGGSERGIGQLPAHLFPWLVLNALLGFTAAHAHLFSVWLSFFTRCSNSFCPVGGSPVPGCTGTSGTSPTTLHCLVL